MNRLSIRTTGVLFGVTTLVSEVLKGDGSVGIAAVGVVRRSWFRCFSFAVALAFLVGGATLARNGFFAPDGGYGFILFWLLPLWVAVTAFVATPRPAS